MKTGRSLSEVLMELQRQNAEKKDFISPSSALMRRNKGSQKLRMTHEARQRIVDVMGFVE